MKKLALGKREKLIGGIVIVVIILAMLIGLTGDKHGSVAGNNINVTPTTVAGKAGDLKSILNSLGGNGNSDLDQMDKQIDQIEKDVSKY